MKRVSYFRFFILFIGLILITAMLFTVSGTMKDTSFFSPDNVGWFSYAAITAAVSAVVSLAVLFFAKTTSTYKTWFLVISLLAGLALSTLTTIGLYKINSSSSINPSNWEYFLVISSLVLSLVIIIVGIFEILSKAPIYAEKYLILKE